jgi:flagellar basal-body rod modification protein FlgD
MVVTGAGAANNTPIVDAGKTGFAGLTADDFMKLLITELQNQDPSEPISNSDLLQQLSTMRNLSANIELSDAMKSITTNQQLSTAATFIGKSVTGITTQNQQASGVVEKAFLRDGKAFVSIGDGELPLTGVSEVAAT